MGKSHFTGRNVLWNLLSYVFSILRFQSRLEFLEFKIHEKRFIRQFLWKYWIIGENIGKTICWRVQIEKRKQGKDWRRICPIKGFKSHKRILTLFLNVDYTVPWYFREVLNQIKKGRVWLTISYVHFCWGQGGTKCAIRRAGLINSHTWYLSFFLHWQNFWRIKFTPKNANFSR